MGNVLDEWVFSCSKILEEEFFYLAPSIGSQRKGVFYKVDFKIFLIVANLCEIADCETFISSAISACP